MGEIGGFQGTELLTISTITNVTMPLIFANYVNNTVYIFKMEIIFNYTREL